MPSRRITLAVGQRVHHLASAHAEREGCTPTAESVAVDKAWGLAAELTMNLLDPADRDAVTMIVHDVFSERRARLKHPSGRGGAG